MPKGKNYFNQEEIQQLEQNAHVKHPTYFRKETKNMNAKEFVERFIMHDSLIDAMSVDDGNATVIMTINFAFWMQKGYCEGDPETGLLAVTFRNVTKLECPDELPFGDISILRVTEEEGSLKFAIMNDMTDDYYDLLIKAESIEVNTM